MGALFFFFFFDNLAVLILKMDLRSEEKSGQVEILSKYSAVSNKINYDIRFGPVGSDRPAS